MRKRNAMLHAALAYAERGWAVLPLQPLGKKPINEMGSRGATTDPAQIRRWWTESPNANVGIATGSASGITVLDVDRKNGKNGETSLKGLLNGHDVLATLEARTPSGGRHLIFAGVDVRNSASALGEGLDVRGEGGYIVAPPSITATGRYEWTNDAPVAAMPPWLAMPSKTVCVDFSPTSIGQGVRNTHLASLAGTMRARGMSRASIEVALLRENDERCDPPLSRTEVRKIAKSIARYEPSGGGGGIKVVTMDSLRPEKTAWVWLEYLARGVFNLLVGLGGLGKSQIALAVAAIVSTGGAFPDGSRAKRGNVVILSAEDHLTKILLPRLLAAGADTSRIHVVQGTVDPRSKQTRLFSFDHDLSALKAKIDEIGDVTLVIVDPITAYMGLKVDSHQTSHVRSWLMPISAFAESLDCAVLIVAHFNKSSDGRSAVDRISGSAAWSQAARRVLFVVQDGDRRVFLRGKTNLSRFDHGGFEFSIVPATVGDGIATTRVKWGAPTDERADDLVRTERAGAIEAAEKWLRHRLSKAPVGARLIVEEAAGQPFSWGTVKRAAKKLAVVTTKTREGWIWRLP